MVQKWQDVSSESAYLLQQIYICLLTVFANDDSERQKKE